jgi:hypothetical protein
MIAERGPDGIEIKQVVRRGGPEIEIFLARSHGIRRVCVGCLVVRLRILFICPDMCLSVG